MNDNKMLPLWYESTQGPQISMTLRALAAMLIPVAKDLFGIEIGSETVNHLIDATLVLGFAIWALVGHLRAKKALVAQIGRLKREQA